MPDIALTWNTNTASADWNFANGDLATGNDLETSVLISLFTDAHATPDFVPQDGDLRGWWGNSYASLPLGSNLWQLTRAKISDRSTMLLQVRDMCQTALQWLIAYGIAASVKVLTSWLSPEAIGINITIQEPLQSSTTTFSYAYAWASVASLPRPQPVILE